MTRNKKILFAILIPAVTIILAAAVYFLIQGGYAEKIISVINEDLHPGLFILLTVILPALGFPVSVFLVAAGLKFGIAWGFLLWVCILLLHTTIGYIAAHFLRPLLVRFFKERMGYTIPSVPDNNQAMFSFLFLAVPGLPYAAKNYILPLAGVAFRYCVIMNCIVQSLIGLPFIILGRSGEKMDPTLFSLAIFAFAVLFVFLRWLKNRYQVEK